MSLMIQIAPDGRAGPVITCDACGEVIATAADGLYLWEEMPLGVTTYAQPAFVHKNRRRDQGCDATYAYFHPWAAHAPWLELDTLPVYLVGSLQVDYAAAHASAEQLAMIGA